MNKILFIVIGSLLLNCNADITKYVDDKLIDALIIVESHGNYLMTGDSGKAFGQLQIHKHVIDDVNRVYKVNYKHNDSFDRGKSRAICKLYLKHYAKAFYRNTGKVASYQELSRIWNRGPKGYLNPESVKYWIKVRKHLSAT